MTSLPTLITSHRDSLGLSKNPPVSNLKGISNSTKKLIPLTGEELYYPSFAHSIPCQHHQLFIPSGTPLNSKLIPSTNTSRDILVSRDAHTVHAHAHTYTHSNQNGSHSVFQCYFKNFHLSPSYCLCSLFFLSILETLPDKSTSLLMHGSITQTLLFVILKEIYVSILNFPDVT